MSCTNGVPSNSIVTSLVEGEKALISRVDQTVVKLKKKKPICAAHPPHTSALSICAQMLCLSFAVVKLPKRWWRPAPKSRGTLRRYTGEWVAPRAPRGIWDGQDLKACFVRSSVTGKGIRLPTSCLCQCHLGDIWFQARPSRHLGSLSGADVTGPQCGYSSTPLWVACSVRNHQLDCTWSVTRTVCVRHGGVISWLRPALLEVLSVPASVYQTWPVPTGPASRLFHRRKARVLISPRAPYSQRSPRGMRNLVISSSRVCTFINVAVYTIPRN